MPELELETWLSPDDVGAGIDVEFVDAGTQGEIPKEGEEANVKTFEITVRLPNAKTKIWTMNKTSQRAVAGGFGTNTDGWVGRSVTIFTTDQNVRGTMKKVIYAKNPLKEEPLLG